MCHGASDAHLLAQLGNVPKTLQQTFLDALTKMPYTYTDEYLNCKELMGAMKEKHGGNWACFGYVGTRSKSWADPTYYFMRGATSRWNWELYLVSPRDTLKNVE